MAGGASAAACCLPLLPCHWMLYSPVEGRASAFLAMTAGGQVLVAAGAAGGTLQAHSVGRGLQEMGRHRYSPLAVSAAATPPTKTQSTHPATEIDTGAGLHDVECQRAGKRRACAARRNQRREEGMERGRHDANSLRQTGEQQACHRLVRAAGRGDRKLLYRSLSSAPAQAVQVTGTGGMGC